MNRPALLVPFFCLCLSFLALATVPVQAEDSPTTPDAVLKVMLNGVEQGDIGKFTHKAEPELKARVTKEVMIRLSGSLGAKLKQGYTMTNIGQLRQDTVITYLYKIEFKNGADDVLVRLAIRGGNVAGIFFE